MSKITPDLSDCVFISVNDLLLHFGRQLCKVSGESSYSNEKIPMVFRVLLCVYQSVSSDEIQLKLEASHTHKRTYELEHLVF